MGYLFNEHFKFLDENLNLKKFDPSLFLNIKHKRQILNSDNYFYLKDKKKEISSCQNSNKALKPLYKVTREWEQGLDQQGLHVHSFVIQDDYHLKKLWHFNDKNLSPSRSNPVLSVNRKTRNPVLILTATDKKQKKTKKNKTYLILLNGKTGQLMGKVLFHGEVHFSMPLIVDNLIFIPTRNHEYKCLL